MLQRMRSQLKFANVIAVIALFVALGSGAYAAGLITGKQIKNNSVKGKDVKESSLVGVDKCPANAATRTQDICVGGLNAATDWDVAARDCLNKGLRLPDLGEALLISNKVTVPYIWTTDIADVNPASLRVVARTDDTGFSRIATSPKTGPVAYVCMLGANN
jgi:hypothetical protein